MAFLVNNVNDTTFDFYSIRSGISFGSDWSDNISRWYIKKKKKKNNRIKKDDVAAFSPRVIKYAPARTFNPRAEIGYFRLAIQALKVELSIEMLWKLIFIFVRKWIDV